MGRTLGYRSQHSKFKEGSWQQLQEVGGYVPAGEGPCMINSTSRLLEIPL